MGNKMRYKKRLARKLWWRGHKGKMGTLLFCAAVLLGLIWFGVFSCENGDGGQTLASSIPEGDGFSMGLCVARPDLIPDYSGEDYVILNDGMPCFNLYDLANRKGETYSELDELGRCGSAVAMLDRSMMPSEERGSIGDIKPTGWMQKKYPGIVDSEPPYLYNRCHLIAYALTGQNANERNLITGTRYMNAQSMLTWEKKVMKYLDHGDHHVLYRVTPFFQGRELVARGVEIEAYSLEDQGRDLCFHVFVYNIQPGIEIDYLTGESRAINE